MTDTTKFPGLMHKRSFAVVPNNEVIAQYHGADYSPVTQKQMERLAKDPREGVLILREFIRRDTEDALREAERTFGLKPEAPAAIPSDYGKLPEPETPPAEETAPAVDEPPPPPAPEADDLGDEELADGPAEETAPAEVPGERPPLPMLKTAKLRELAAAGAIKAPEGIDINKATKEQILAANA